MRLPCAAQAYPLAHAVQEGSKFALQLGYLVERTAYYSPALWLLRQRIVRVSGGELVRCIYICIVLQSRSVLSCAGLCGVALQVLGLPSGCISHGIVSVVRQSAACCAQLSDVTATTWL